MIRGYRCFEEIPNVPDRLRWSRQRLGLKQKEVAEAVGITRGMYTDMENGKNDHYPAETVDKLAALFEILPSALLDDYNLFLYQGQWTLIRAYRRQLAQPDWYLKNCHPRLGKDFLLTARNLMTEEIRADLETITDFRFEDHTVIHIPGRSPELLTELVRRQMREILN